MERSDVGFSVINAEPYEQNNAASRADSRNVSFLIGSDLAKRRSKKGDCPSLHPVKDDIWRRSLHPFSPIPYGCSVRSLGVQASSIY
jgi:hypothetical protein